MGMVSKALSSGAAMVGYLVGADVPSSTWHTSEKGKFAAQQSLLEP